MAAAGMKNRDNIGENVYSGIFGVLDYKSIIRFSKFKMADLRWRPPKWKTTVILVKMYIQRFLGSLIVIPLSDFQNSKWRIKDDGRRNEMPR